MFVSRNKSNVFLLIVFCVVFFEVVFNYQNYMVDESEIICESGKVESFSSPRSSATLFYSMESGVRFYAESFNKSKGAPYTSVVNGQYSFNRDVHTLCYLRTNRFIYFDVYYVVYFGDYSDYMENYSELMSAIGLANNRTIIYFIYLSLCFVCLVVLVKKIRGFYS